MAELKQNNSTVYGSIWVKGVELALCARAVKEVVSEAKNYNPIPQSERYVIGAFSLRDMVLPVIDLEILLDIKSETSGNAKNRKVAIIEQGDRLVGIRFDRTGEIFKTSESQKKQMSVATSASVQNLIDGAFQLEDNQRVVQVLNSKAIFELPNLPTLQYDVGSQKRKYSGVRKKCISFTMGPLNCAVKMEALKETLLVKNEELRSPMYQVEHCVGDIDLRGVVLPVIDFSAFMGFETTYDSESQENRIVVVKDSENQLGLLVSCVENIIQFFDDEVTDFTGNSNFENGQIFSHCVKSNEKNVLIIDHGKLLNDPKVKSLTTVYAEMQKKELAKNEGQKSSRQTLITFTVDRSYALPIKDVQEVIGVPEEILSVSGGSAALVGAINLRNQMVTIVKTSELLNMQNTEAVDESKILIFNFQQELYGLIVNSIDSIIKIDSGDIRKLPAAISNSLSPGVHDAGCKYVKVEGNGQEQTFFMVSVQSLAEKIKGINGPAAQSAS